MKSDHQSWFLVVALKCLFGAAFLWWTIWLVFHAGCSLQRSKTAPNILEQQTPGIVEGGGAKLTSPGNAASPTTMTAEKRTGFYPPPHYEPLPRFSHEKKSDAPAETPAPAWIDEKVTTSIGQHQSAEAIIKVAEQANKWSKTRWIGICLVVGSILIALYYRGTPDGYPMIYMKIGVIGAGIAIIDPSPWWLTALIIPAAFYVAQKFNLLKIPLP